LADIYTKFADDWNNVTPAVERAQGFNLFGRRLGPMGKIAFLKRLSNLDQEYMRKLRKKTKAMLEKNQAMPEKTRRSEQSDDLSRLAHLSRLEQMSRKYTPTDVVKYSGNHPSVQPGGRSKVISRIHTQNLDEYDGWKCFDDDVDWNHPIVHGSSNHSKIPEHKTIHPTPLEFDDDI
jgi:hypothetical protein